MYFKMEKITRPTTGVKNILEMTILQVVRYPVQLLYEIKQCVSGKMFDSLSDHVIDEQLLHSLL